MKLPTKRSPVRYAVGDAAAIDLPDDSVDLVLCSPPYEDARTYGIGFGLAGQAWVDWAVQCYIEHLRVCRGLVAWVVEGRTTRRRWSATPALLMADLHRYGVRLRKPPIYARKSIPGSGGRDWLRNDYELIVCATKADLPWSDPTACGKPPKCPPGGKPSNRQPNGSRERQNYKPPKLANPGNIIDCGAVGGGNMGHQLAHENEAPYPLKLAEFFVRSFCPPGGVVLDPFAGSGTTGHAAVLHGRRAILTDARQSQIDLSRQRVGGVIKERASK